MVSDHFKDAADSTKEVVKRFIHLDLHGSEVGVAGGIAYDQNDIRGPFIDTIDYKAWLALRQHAAAGPGGALDTRHFVRTVEAPTTQDSSGAVSSSISFNVNGSAGFFGPAPMAMGGGGISIGQTHSHQLQDFTFYNQSTEATLHHVLRMTGAADGEPYHRPRDLWNTYQSPFVGARLRPLPALAKSNVPIVGQLVWMNATDESIARNFELDLHLAIQARFSFIAASAKFIYADRSYWSYLTPVFNFRFPFDYAATDKTK